jgi:hypothetical protein
MAALTGQKIQDSYEQILHVDRDGGGNGSTPVQVKDGDNGTTFALELATDKVRVADPSSGNRAEVGHGSAGTGYVRLTADDGTDIYLWITKGEVAYEIRVSTTKPS